MNGSGSAAQDGTFSGSLAPLATDTEGDPLTFSAVTQPLYGTLNLSPDGNFVYTPTAGFSGADLFFLFESRKSGACTSVNNTILALAESNP